jgi:uracil-DNA glycosylase
MFFYDASAIAILPMAFCYPGTGKSADLPPPVQCAEQWRAQLLKLLPNIELTLVIGQYALDWHLGKTQHATPYTHQNRDSLARLLAQPSANVSPKSAQ